MVIEYKCTQYNGGFLPDILPLGNPVKYHVGTLYL